MVEVTFPYTLTEADREELAALLTALPTLRYPIAPEEKDAFEQAYRQLAQRPAWLPILISANTMEQRKADQEHVRGQHQKALLQEASDGRITLLDAHHARVEGPGAVAFLARTQAIAYLERHGLAYRTAEQDAPQPASQKSEDNAQMSDLQAPFNTSPVGIPQATPEQKAAAVKLSKDLEQQGIRDFVARAARKFDVSTKSISNWRKEAEKNSVTPESVIAQSYAKK